MRLQKYLAQCGIGSRRICERYILNGDVSVNGVPVNELGCKIDPETDQVSYKGEVIKCSESKVYYMLNKPKAVVTTSKDQFNRLSVLDIVKVKERIYPVGRLDYNTTGLLVLTNDGELAQRLTHPRHDIEKVYRVLVQGNVTQEELNLLRHGIVIDGKKTRKSKVTIVKYYSGKNRTLLEICIREGRNRQVRKMCQAAGHHVIYLERIAIGSLNLGNLKIGEYRMLTLEEKSQLKKEVGL
ncbi:pseudouridine synthase [Tindallia californiensis]|uniref:Pseudouridine synthase n=1 Tax=Tindallia californiensis TaxID=159292 RepID=A0A1H3NMK7_9FIRM|nr:pseudouridine synthase [Tindallia californiensis]SDY90187.1 ribosomal large subunit pseudouridine synthase B [Tindallia californiensis]